MGRLGLRDRGNKPREDLSIEEVKEGTVPRHVAIIMDGNGRWARRRRQPRLAGHRAGSKAIRRVVEVAADLGVEYLTLYTFSTENWRRPKDEVSGLMRLFEDQIAREIEELHRNDVKVSTIGRLDALPESTRNAFAKAAERTRDNTGLNLIIAVNYSGRAEIVDAARALCEAVKSGGICELDEDMFADYLYTSGIPDPELLIRTSGELRVSNFLLWQIAYSEIWITEKLWPDFSKHDFVSAVADFQKRKRRFGGLDSEQ